jgi:sugar phosphate isomerase/epimerase
MTVLIGIDNVCYNHTMRTGGMDVVGFLDKAAVYGARVVQMDPLWPSQGLDLSDAGLIHLRGLLDERSLELVVKGNSGGLGSLANPPEASQDGVALFCSKIEAAVKLNASIVRVVTRAYPYPTKHTSPPQGVPREQVIDWVIANLRMLTPLAEDMGVRIAVENHGDVRIAELERILSEVDSPALGVQYDLLEQVAIFEDPRLAAERLLSYIFTVHWNDAYPRLSSTGFCVQPCPPGEGILDLNGISRSISSLEGDIYVFTAFQADSIESEDQLVKEYIKDLYFRFANAVKAT